MSINSAKEGGVTRLSDYFDSNRSRNSTAEERRVFVNWLFEHIMDFRVDSKNKLANAVVERYKHETSIHINKEWIYALIRLGIYKDGDDFRFQEESKYSFEELCNKPSLIRHLR